MKTDYKRLYFICRQYACGKTSRERFVLDWGLEQRRQGVVPAVIQGAAEGGARGGRSKRP